jgi:hypothetical protein
MDNLDDAASGASGASRDGHRLAPVPQGDRVALEAGEDVVLVVGRCRHIDQSLVSVCHRLPELRLFWVAFDTPICLPFPA